MQIEILVIVLFIIQFDPTNANTAAGFAEKCLMPGTSDLASSALNWDNIQSLDELDYCLMTAAERLLNPEKLMDWMSASGFQMSKTRTFSRNTMMASYNYDGEGILIGGFIPKDEFKWRIHPLRTFPAYNMSSGILFRDDGTPLHVTSVLNTK